MGFICVGDSTSVSLFVTFAVVSSTGCGCTGCDCVEIGMVSIDVVVVLTVSCDSVVSDCFWGGLDLRKIGFHLHMISALLVILGSLFLS